MGWPLLRYSASWLALHTRKRSGYLTAISNILHSIPAIDGDLGSRLTSAGLQVKMIGITAVSKEDVIYDSQRSAMGDVEISVVTDGDPRSGNCQIMGSPTFVKRRGKYLPQDRTGVWLLTGKCELPD